MIKKCSICKKEVDINFEPEDQICGGKNEICGNCGSVLWIPYSESREKFALLPIILLATK